jgi:hypothetical protein
MQKTLSTSIAVLSGLSGAPAKAMPFGSLFGAPPDVISVATGCGPDTFPDLKRTTSAFPNHSKSSSPSHLIFRKRTIAIVPVTTSSIS